MVIRVHWKIGRIGLYTYTGHKHKITASYIGNWCSQKRRKD